MTIDKNEILLACDVNRAIYSKDANLIIQTVRSVMEHHGLFAHRDAIASLPIQAAKPADAGHGGCMAKLQGS